MSELDAKWEELDGLQAKEDVRLKEVDQLRKRVQLAEVAIPAASFSPAACTLLGNAS